MLRQTGQRKPDGDVARAFGPAGASPLPARLRPGGGPQPSPPTVLMALLWTPRHPTVHRGQRGHAGRHSPEPRSPGRLPGLEGNGITLLTYEQPPAPRDDVLHLRRRGPSKRGALPGSGGPWPVPSCGAWPHWPAARSPGRHGPCTCFPGNVSVQGSSVSSDLGGLCLHPGVSAGPAPGPTPGGRGTCVYLRRGFGDKEPVSARARPAFSLAGPSGCESRRGGLGAVPRPLLRRRPQAHGAHTSQEPTPLGSAW